MRAGWLTCDAAELETSEALACEARHFRPEAEADHVGGARVDAVLEEALQEAGQVGAGQGRVGNRIGVPGECSQPRPVHGKEVDVPPRHRVRCNMKQSPQETAAYNVDFLLLSKYSIENIATFPCQGQDLETRDMSGSLSLTLSNGRCARAADALGEAGDVQHGGFRGVQARCSLLHPRSQRRPRSADVA